MSYQRKRSGVDVKIWRTQLTEDRRGNQTIAPFPDDPLLERVAVIPDRSSRAEVPGQQSISVYKILVDPDIDVSLWARVEWADELWDVIAPPEYHHGTKRHTRHWTIGIRRRPHSNG